MSNAGKKFLLGTAAIAVVATPAMIDILTPRAVRAQKATDWQTKAGGKMSFEVASVKLSDPDTFRPPNFPLDPGDSFGDVHGRLSANLPLMAYISFAWKDRLTATQLQAANSQLPKWVSTDRYDIEARAPGNPTKDQMRLMMQALLATRFQLVVHFETREMPVLAMTLIKPGKTGPGLRPHAEGPSCDQPPSPALFPPTCEVMPVMFEGPGRRAGGRNVTPDMIAWRLPPMGIIDRPGIDRTGLTGTFDFTFTWTADATPPGATTKIRKKGPASDTPAAPPAAEPATEAPGFIEAVREQLGIKLESTKGPVQRLIIDRVERPSAN